MSNLYVDIHVLQIVPPGCINRDDTGSPKTAKYGGVTRARVSSQSWKHEMRLMFKEIFDKDKVGVRTKKVSDMLASEIMSLDSGIDEERASKLAEAAMKNAGIKPDNVLKFFSVAQAKKLAQLAINGSKDAKEYKEALKEAPSVDMALFGRMVAADPSLNYDASAQVAHAISTHAVHNEYDYFTAVDDLNKEDEAGAGHLGTIEFNSSTLYRYATVNIAELKSSLGDFTVDALAGFVRAFVKSMPTGKQNTFANRTMPDYVYITLRTDQPINLVSAFEKPITSTDGYLEKSKAALMKHAAEVYEKYDCCPVQTWSLDTNTFNRMIEELCSAVKEKLAESEGE